MIPSMKDFRNDFRIERFNRSRVYAGDIVAEGIVLIIRLAGHSLEQKGTNGIERKSRL